MSVGDATRALGRKLRLPAMSSVPDARHDRAVLYAAAFVRAVATSFVGVTIGVFLASLASRRRRSVSSLRVASPTIAVYTMLQDIGHALGSLAAALPAVAAAGALV